MIKEAISKVVLKDDLNEEEMQAVMEEIMTGAAMPSQIGSFLTALRMKGETVEEITGAARIMRNHARKIDAGTDRVLDTCGTGGDGAHTFNISTLTALAACAAGAKVAKHGNRSVSSKCGSADLLKELGVNIEAPPETVEKCLREIRIGFLFAPLLHGAMKHAIGPRREIAIRTIFNVLGPLTNPAGAEYQLLGVYSEALAPALAQVLARLGTKHALVVHGADGLDEVTTTTETLICEVRNGKVSSYRIRPQDFGITPAKPEALKGGEASVNRQIALDVLSGKKGECRDAVVLNAGCALYAADVAPGIKEGTKLADDALASGKAMKKLEQLKAATNQGSGS